MSNIKKSFTDFVLGSSQEARVKKGTPNATQPVIRLGMIGSLVWFKEYELSRSVMQAGLSASLRLRNQPFGLVCFSIKKSRFFRFQRDPRIETSVFNE